MDILTRLRLRGFDITIVDLGAGYVFLQAPLNCPFSSPKIDKSFVAGMATSRDSLSIMGAIAAILRDLGVDALQGALLSMPLSAGDLIAWEATRLRAWFQAGAADRVPGADAGDPGAQAVQ